MQENIFLIMLTFENLQQGHKYFLRNYSEESRFEVLEILNDTDCIVKHLETLEVFHLADLVQFGISKNYEIREI